jgi:hypothetical protein
LGACLIQLVGEIEAGLTLGGRQFAVLGRTLDQQLRRGLVSVAGVAQHDQRGDQK